MSDSEVRTLCVIISVPILMMAVLNLGMTSTSFIGTDLSGVHELRNAYVALLLQVSVLFLALAGLVTEAVRTIEVQYSLCIRQVLIMVLFIKGTFRLYCLVDGSDLSTKHNRRLGVASYIVSLTSLLLGFIFLDVSQLLCMFLMISTLSFHLLTITGYRATRKDKTPKVISTLNAYAASASISLLASIIAQVLGFARELPFDLVQVINIFILLSTSLILEPEWREILRGFFSQGKGMLKKPGVGIVTQQSVVV